MTEKLKNAEPLEAVFKTLSLLKGSFALGIIFKNYKDFVIGATILNLTERPYTDKINTGDEPISNTIWGLDGTYQTEAPWMTKAIDFIPLLSLIHI